MHWLTVCPRYSKTSDRSNRSSEVRLTEFLTGSSLELLRGFPDGAFDMVMTSPLYANRYELHTNLRTGARLACVRSGTTLPSCDSVCCRQRSKINLSWSGCRETYQEDPTVVEDAIDMYRSQAAIGEVLDILREHVGDLGNRHVIRLIESYFLEMSLIVAELGRIVRPGGTVIMVNDNVQYHGVQVPVDLILSDLAGQSGFRCRKIWRLPLRRVKLKPADAPIRSARNTLVRL